MAQAAWAVAVLGAATLCGATLVYTPSDDGTLDPSKYVNWVYANQHRDDHLAIAPGSYAVAPPMRASTHMCFDQPLSNLWLDMGGVTLNMTERLLGALYLSDWSNVSLTGPEAAPRLPFPHTILELQRLHTAQSPLSYHAPPPQIAYQEVPANQAVVTALPSPTQPAPHTPHELPPPPSGTSTSMEVRVPEGFPLQDFQRSSVGSCNPFDPATLLYKAPPTPSRHLIHPVSWLAV
eukprot:gene1372-2752_t